MSFVHTWPNCQRKYTPNWRDLLISVIISRLGSNSLDFVIVLLVVLMALSPICEDEIHTRNHSASSIYQKLAIENGGFRCYLFSSPEDAEKKTRRIWHDCEVERLWSGAKEGERATAPQEHIAASNSQPTDIHVNSSPCTLHANRKNALYLFVKRQE